MSDLIGPLWCEVQHTYRLKSRSHLPPSARPTTIVGSTGASIELDQKRTAAREDILNKGRKVHAKLEKQVMGETQPVQVAVTGAEEWWALRCLNLLVCLDALFHTGEARELPVFGYVGSLLVFGVIDDVARRELPPAVLATPPSKKRKGVQGGSSKKKAGKEPEPTNTLDKYFATGSQSQRRDSPEIPAQDWGFIVSDTKTRCASTPAQYQTHAERRCRRSRYAPRERDTLGPRFQVMLYFRFLRSLLSSNGNTDTSGSSEDGSRFPWARLASERALSLGAPLSQAFRDSITPAVFGSELVESLLAHTLAETPALPSQGDAGASAPDDANSTSDTMTLGHLIRALETFGQLLESDSRLRDDLLELTYVRRESSASVISPPSSSAVAAAGLSSPASPESGATSSTASLDPSASQQSRGRRRKTPAAASSSIETSGSSGGGGGASSTSILAQMVFKYDKAQLDGWLTRATQLWNGETEPLGVPPAEVFKCRYVAGDVISRVRLLMGLHVRRVQPVRVRE